MLNIVKTEDGSNTIFNNEVGENYHSKHGALQESRHVFLKSGLEYFLEKRKVSLLTNEGDQPDVHVNLKEAVSILEVGFGTGLNFLLSADYCIAQNKTLDYVGIEAYPLSEEMISETGYDEYIAKDIWKSFLKLYPATFQHPIGLNNQCELHIANCKLMDFQSAKLFNVIYFDAFAAAYQPEMWNEAAIAHTLKFLKPGGVFVTYAITGNLKRIIKTLGLKVEKAPGAAGKREMLRAVRCADTLT